MALYAFDGTLNEPSESNPKKVDTNVVRFIEYLEKEKDLAVLTFISEDAEYVEGVGNRFGWIGMILGGFSGAGGRKRVRELMEKFIENWRAGDTKVEVIGFSRGAALALHFCNALADGVEIDGKKVVPEIRFLGLWDTVPAFGLPGVLIDAFQDINIGWRLNVPANVKRCCHAMALDEDRQAFQVHRPAAKDPAATVLEEVWFRGVHGDVGGGREDRGLSSIPLAWMLDRATESGVAIDRAKRANLDSEFKPDAPPNKNTFSGEKEYRKPRPGDQFHESAAMPLAIGEAVQVVADSKQLFNVSRVLLQPGHQYVFAVDPDAKWVDKAIVCTAKGWPDKLPNNKPGMLDDIQWAILNSYIFSNLRRVRAANWFELVACVERDLDTAVPIGQGQHAEGAKPWIPSATGRLSLFANDSAAKYGNNEGSLPVKITRVA